MHDSSHPQLSIAEWQRPGPEGQAESLVFEPVLLLESLLLLLVQAAKNRANAI